MFEGLKEFIGFLTILSISTLFGYYTYCNAQMGNNMLDILSGIAVFFVILAFCLNLDLLDKI